MKSYKKLLLERVNIRCAMWAMGLITEAELDSKLENVAALVDMIETKKEQVNLISVVDLFNPYPVHARHIPGLLTHLEKSNQTLVEEYFK